MTYNKYILILSLFIGASAFSQNTKVNFDAEIKELNLLGMKIIGSDDDEKKAQSNLNFKAALLNTIKKESSFSYSFDSLKTISILKEGDLKIYNWALPLSDGTFKYFAFFQIQKSKNEFDIIELIDKSETIKTPENKVLTTKSWYGALYYKIISNKKIGKNYYTVLGWDGNNNLTNKKIIDIIYLSGNGMIKFGAPIFKTKKKTKKRIIFEYSSSSVMSLKYHENNEKIVFDFLVPASSKLKGVYEYYGPSLDTFDAFILEKNKWVYEKNTDIKLNRNIKDFMWKDPKEQ